MGIDNLDRLIPVPQDSYQISDVSSENISAHPVRFSLVIPTYNEAKNVTSIVAKLTTLLDSILPEDYELIVVDDDSADRTWNIALEMTQDYPQLRVMRRVDEKGLSTAVIRGWQAAQGEVLGVIDADLQHPPQTLLHLWQEMDRGADLAVASRHQEGGGVSEWSIIRRFLSRGAQMIGLLILPGVIGKVSDPMSGYFLIRRDCLIGRTLNPIGYKILIEVLGRGQVRWVAETGYVFQERQEGDSKVTWKQYVEYIQHLLRLRFTRWPIGRFLKFGVVGGSGVVVNMGVLFLLREYAGLGLTRSVILAAEMAIVNNFLWNDLWTFRDISRKQPRLRQRLKRFLKFNVISLSALILNVLLVNAMFNWFGINEYVANLIAIAAVTFWNFWFNLKLSWRVTDPGQ